ncbi:hypothetical protein AOQ73_05920 [Bradyrhizobium pachyrhizi]|uniref:hypothetical protein n=1 Tax=Bradyrhizobium pachyrhizi TaxID=280333 RepID=UPI00070567B9|nr:hypothetical protein [Bradyrhizobium pachyrhizi]KRQ11943.1 hypothetical protein AOQ73_05920 [Bradyrhizobium pachyrhizi]
MNTTDSIINVESGGDPTARNSKSSAAGPGQFINSTWLATIKAHRPDIAAGKSDAELLALKNDPQLASQPQNVALANEMTGAYASDNQAYLRQNGVPVTPGTTYLAHFAGPQGAVKVLQADPNAPASTILGAAAVTANPFLNGMTAQGLQAWAAKKMGSASPTAAPAATAAAAPVGAPGTPSAAPAAPAPQQQPIFANAPAAPTMPAYRDPTPPPVQPIFAPEPRQVDLSGLRAALARAPIFASRQG